MLYGGVRENVHESRLNCSTSPAASRWSPARRAGSACASPKCWPRTAPRSCWWRAAPTGSTALKQKIEDAGGQAIVAEADVLDRAAMVRAFDAAEKAFGTVTILINNAGVTHADRVVEMPEETWRRVLGTNLDAVLYWAQEAARRMIAAKKQGAIVNIASILGFGVVEGRRRLFGRQGRRGAAHPGAGAGACLQGRARQRDRARLRRDRDQRGVSLRQGRRDDAATFRSAASARRATSTAPCCCSPPMPAASWPAAPSWSTAGRCWLAALWRPSRQRASAARRRHRLDAAAMRWARSRQPSRHERAPVRLPAAPPRIMRRHPGEHRGDEQQNGRRQRRQIGDRRAGAESDQSPAGAEQRRAARATDGRSRSRVGHAATVASTGRSRRRTSQKPGIDTASAAAITIASVGSQPPLRDREHVEEAEHSCGVVHPRDDQPGAEDEAAEERRKDRHGASHR